MSTKRIIPCLDIRDGKVVKGVNFENVKEVGDPVELAGYYDETGADEMAFYDITASAEGRILFTDLLKAVSEKTSVPITAAGGISTISDCDRVLKNGADKVSLNSGAIKDPMLIKAAADKYGSGRVIVSMDVKRADGRFMVFVKGGTENTGIEATEWAKKCEALGAGEFVINSIDTDGVKGGYDLKLISAITEAVKIPVIASGGAGKKEDFTELFKNTGADAGLAASVFHFKEVNIRELKAFLFEQGIEVRK